MGVQAFLTSPEPGFLVLDLQPALKEQHTLVRTPVRALQNYPPVPILEI
jgi:hypothetical protein